MSQPVRDTLVVPKRTASELNVDAKNADLVTRNKFNYKVQLRLIQIPLYSPPEMMG